MVWPCGAQVGFAAGQVGQLVQQTFPQLRDAMNALKTWLAHEVSSMSLAFSGSMSLQQSVFTMAFTRVRGGTLHSLVVTGGAGDWLRVFVCCCFVCLTSGLNVRVFLFLVGPSPSTTAPR